MVAHQLATDAFDPFRRWWWKNRTPGSVAISAPLGSANSAGARFVSFDPKGEHLPVNLGAAAHDCRHCCGVGVGRRTARIDGRSGAEMANDIMLSAKTRKRKKVGGILIETSYVQEQVEYAIVGIGINVNQTQESLPQVPPNVPPPTSLRLAVGRTIDRTSLLIALCRAWEELVTPQDSPHDIHHEWRNLLLTLGQPVTVILHRDGERQLNGVAVDVTADGALVVMDELGRSHLLDAGDVTTRLP